MTIGDIHQVYVQGKVDESDIGKIYLGQTARIKVESFKDKSFYGKVTRIAPLGVEKDNVTTFEVRVSIDNPGGELKANILLREYAAGAAATDRGAAPRGQVADHGPRRPAWPGR